MKEWWLGGVKFQKATMFPPGFEPGTFCVLDRCDNHYTMETRFCLFQSSQYSFSDHTSVHGWLLSPTFSCDAQTDA